MINPSIKKLAEELNYPLEEVLHFHFLMEFKSECPGLENYILQDHIFPYAKFQEYQINFCTFDPETKELQMKYPLYVKNTEDDFDLLLRTLSEKGIVSKGYINTPLEYSIFSKKDKEIYLQLKRTMDLEVDRTCDVIANYYMSTAYPTKLALYLESPNFKMDYNAY